LGPNQLELEIQEVDPLAASGLSGGFQEKNQEVDQVVALASSEQMSQPTEQAVIVEEGQEGVLVFGRDFVACKRSPGLLANLVVDLQAVEEADIVDCMFVESFLGLSLEARKSKLEDEVRGGSAVEEELQLMIQDSRVSQPTCRIRTQWERMSGQYFCESIPLISETREGSDTYIFVKSIVIVRAPLFVCSELRTFEISLSAKNCLQVF
jgi:hypothetical protein